jgi:hypothetical protein
VGRLRTRIVTRTLSVTPADLTAPTPPAPQSLASSATTASLTWTHAGAPPGTTYALAVVDEAGTTVTPDSGSGLGPYVIPVASGKAYSATLTATGTDGQTSQSSALVQVAASGSAPGWDVALDLDLTGLTVATLTSGDETDVTRSDGGATVATVWSLAISNSGDTTAGATGIRCNGASAGGSVSALIDVADAADLTMPGDMMHGLAVDIYLDDLGDWTGAGTAWRAGISADQTRFSAGTSSTVQGLLSTTLQNRRIATNESFTTWASGEAIPTGAWVVTLLVLSGEVVWAFYGADAASDADLDALTDAALLSATIGADVSSAPAGTRYGTALYAGIMAQLQADLTWTRLRVRRRRLA